MVETKKKPGKFKVTLKEALTELLQAIEQDAEENGNDFGEVTLNSREMRRGYEALTRCRWRRSGVKSFAELVRTMTVGQVADVLGVSPRRCDHERSGLGFRQFARKL